MFGINCFQGNPQPKRILFVKNHSVSIWCVFGACLVSIWFPFKVFSVSVLCLYYLANAYISMSKFHVPYPFPVSSLSVNILCPFLVCSVSVLCLFCDHSVSVFYSFCICSMSVLHSLSILCLICVHYMPFLCPFMCIMCIYWKDDIALNSILYLV
jgi:hypothetical protein